VFFAQKITDYFHKEHSIIGLIQETLINAKCEVITRFLNFCVIKFVFKMSRCLVFWNIL